MVVYFSRHAKRRAKLYDISESEIEKFVTNLDLKEGEHELIADFPGFKYPIKIIISVENNIVTVITNYPLKKGRKNESPL